MFPLHDLTRLRPARTCSVTAENPTGEKAGGAKAAPGDDVHTADAAHDLGRGWKVRPCLRLLPGETATLCDLRGPGVVRHVWMTVDPARGRLFTLRVHYDGHDTPAVRCPVVDFFANGLDGRARVASLPVAVNPVGGMNSYWPMPFRERLKITVTNDWPTPRPDLRHLDEPREEFFYQITYAEEDVPDDAACLHTQWRRATAARENPEHVILDGVEGRGQYVGTYLLWHQLSQGWWGEGEVKFFVDGDREHPTICGTGTEDYFGGAWCFAENDRRGRHRPVPYSTAFLGYPQVRTDRDGPPVHALYRWHVPDPVRFDENLRVTVQTLGWHPTGRYQPLADDLISLAYWYQAPPRPAPGDLPPPTARLIR